MNIIPPSSAPEGAAQLNETNPCRTAWCTATGCSWATDDVDGSLYRLHSRLDEASGVEMTQYEYGPGDSRNAEPAIYVRNGWAGDLTVAEALAARAALDQMLTALA